MKLGSYADPCRVLFREMANKQAQVETLLSDLPEEARRKATTEVLNGMAKQPGKAGLIASELIINGYLSGPATPFINAISALTQVVMQPLIRTVEAALPRKLLQRQAEVQETDAAGNLVTRTVMTEPERRRMTEGLSMVQGIMQGFLEGASFAARGFVTGRPLEVNMSPKAFGMSDAEFQKFVRDNFIPEERAEMLKAQLYDYSQKQIPGRLGDAIRLPTRIGIFVDEFSKAVLRRMEYNALARRKSYALAEKSGENANDLYNKMIAERFTADNWEQKIKEQLGGTGLFDVQAFAKESVFQEKLTGLAATVAKTRAENPWSVLLIPFVKTPYNILKEGMSYVPGSAFVIKKEIGQSGKFDLAININEQRGKMLAKQTMGLGAILTLYSLAEKGLFTGSNPEDGSPPFSLKVGDTWYSYAKIEPLATIMGMSADAQKIVNEYKDNKNPDKKATDYLLAYGEAVKANIFEKSFMEGLSKAIFAMTDAERHGEAFLTSYANALVPTLSATVARVTDPYERESMTFLERAQSRIPVLRESLPIKYKPTGGTEEPSLSGALLGIKVVTPTNVEKALTDIGVEMSPVTKNIKGVELSTEQYARLKEITGNLVAKAVTDIQKDKRFMALDEYQKEAQMNTVLRKLKNAASLQLVGEIKKTDPEFSRKVFNAMVEKYGLQEVTGYQQP